MGPWRRPQESQLCVESALWELLWEMGVSWTPSSGCFCDQDNCSSPVPQRMPACESELTLEEVGPGWLASNFFSLPLLRRQALQTVQGWDQQLFSLV